jgi:hypothetical protein
MRRFVSGGLIAAALGATFMVAGALPVSAQVARPQSALATGDNSDLLTLVQQRGGRGGGDHADRGGRGGGDRADRGGRNDNIGNRGGRNDNAGNRGRQDRPQASRGRDNSNVRISRNNTRHWNNNNRQRWSNNWRWRHNRWNNYGVGFGIGFAAPLYGAYAYQPGYGGDDAVAYCMSRFQSYDPDSGTYLGYDGLRHPCP